jgi:hypothetical protein
LVGSLRVVAVVTDITFAPTQSFARSRLGDILKLIVSDSQAMAWPPGSGVRVADIV